MTVLWFWLNRKIHTHTMEKVYETAGVRRQSFSDWLNHKMKQKDMYSQLLPLVREIRVEHPGMSSKIMYGMIKPEGIGRDKFISLCNDQGFKLEQKRNPIRTTNSYGVTKFTNKIRDLEVRRSNHLWVSDITYYRIRERFYYITLIMDQYSKMIVGYNASISLTTTDTTIPSLKMTLNNNQVKEELILHSDGGGQYYCKEFITMTKKAQIINSMTEDLAENNHAERINGTIKNQYLSYYMSTDFYQLKKELERAVRNYNETRPHQSLKKQFPYTLHQESIKKKESISQLYLQIIPYSLSGLFRTAPCTN